MNQDWWERPVCVVCDYWWAFLVGLVLIISTLLTQRYWRPWLGLSSDVVDAVEVVERAPITQLNPGESPEIIRRLLSVAETYSSPESRPFSATYFTQSVPTLSDADYQTQTQVIQGNLVSMESVEGLKEDWPTAYVIWIRQDAELILALFRGGVDHLVIGKEITAGGVYDPMGNGLHLDWIEQEQQSIDPQPINEGENIGFFVIAGVVGIWTAYALISLMTKNRTHLNGKIIALLLVVVFKMTGCTLNIHTVVDLDGQGLVITEVCEDVEIFEFIRQTPDMKEFLLDSITNFRNLGLFYEDLIVGNQECFTFQNPFSGLGNIADASGADDESSWVYVSMREKGLMVTTRYTGLIDTRKLYDFYPTISPLIQTEMRKALDEVPLKFSVSLPGEVVYHNADYLEDQIAYWQIPMNGSREVVIESVTTRSELEESDVVPDENFVHFNWEAVKWLIVGAVFIISTVVIVITRMGATHEVR